MNAIELLKQRQSTPVLSEPAPSNADLSTLLAAGMRVPDHGGLTPWHFHVVSGDGLNRLSELYVEAVTSALITKSKVIDGSHLDADAVEAKKVKTAKMPFRAPMIIVISTRYTLPHKVPMQEQLISAGCCAHAMQMAACALGYGAMWRTGDLAYNDTVKKGLGISTDNQITGFLYIGTPTKVANPKPTKDFANYVTYWQ